MKGDSMTGRKFPVISPGQKRRRRARRPSLPAPGSLRLGVVDATVARGLIGQIALIASWKRLFPQTSLSAVSLDRIAALASDLSEIIERAEVRA